MKLNRQVVDMITSRMDFLGMSHNDLARKLNMPQPTVSRILNGGTKLDLVRLPTILSALDLTLYVEIATSTGEVHQFHA